MTTTAAVYPEVRELLEAPDRIRREAFKLLEAGELERLETGRGFRFTVYRHREGGIQQISFPVDDVSRSIYTRPIELEAIRKEIFLKLVEILEGSLVTIEDPNLVGRG